MQRDLNFRYTFDCFLYKLSAIEIISHSKFLKNEHKSPGADRFLELANLLKDGFHMIANDRGSQTIAKRAVSISSRTIANDRRAAISFCGNVNVLARCARGKIRANNMADIEEKISLQANLFLFSVLKRRRRQLQNRCKHREIFMKRQDKLNFSAIFSQLLGFLFLSLKFLLLRL